MEKYMFFLWMVSCIFFLFLAKGVGVSNSFVNASNTTSATFPDNEVLCEFYNKTECIKSEDNEHTTKCSKIKSCGTAENHERYNCFALWTYDHDVTANVSLKGCFPNAEECYNQFGCKTKIKVTTRYMSCCCEDNLCNTSVHIENDNANKQTNSKALPIIFKLVTFVLVLVLVVALFCRLLDKCTRNEGTHSVELIPRGKDHWLDESLIQFTEEKCLSDHFGICLYKAQYKNSEVAVKVFTKRHKDAWYNERNAFKHLDINHPNIVRLIGVGYQPTTNQYWLATEFHNLGSLFDYLKHHTLSWKEVCLISESMARGLAYLHITTYKNEGKPSIAHRNFKSKNVLLKDDLTACISDFYLAVAFDYDTVYRKAHLQWGAKRYMAPEFLENANKQFRAVSFLPGDVYSFALVLWELVSRCTHCGPVLEYKLPYEEEVGTFPDLHDFQRCVVQKGDRPKIQEAWRKHYCLNIFCSIMERCWDYDADVRFTASYILDRMEILTNVAEVISNKN